MDESPEAALWRAVLLAGLADEQKQPGWLGSRDFTAVCHLALVDPEAVEMAAHAARPQGKRGTG